ncbi:restriction endonuclease subunit S [Nitrincola sp. MINF-07-Sa-05]|uniref:restriction endonuclease subunit S n=1 Tax=Nitrincola salilacus TaxID=3400273 RepID=UPI003917FFD3
MNKYTQPLANLVVSKGLQTGPFGSQLKAEEYTEDGIPIVMPKDIYGGKIKTDTIARTSIEKAKSLQKHFLQEGDILFPRRGDLGRIAVASKDNEGWICGTGCIRARLSEEVLPKYIHQFVLMPQVVRWLENNALGQTMLNLNTTIIGELPVYAPPMETQESIADALHTWDNAIEKTEALIAAKEKQFEWLAQSIIRKRCSNWKHYLAKDLFDSVSSKGHPDEELLSVTQDRGVIPRTMLKGRVMSPAGSTAGYKLVEKGNFVISLRSFQGGLEYSDYRGIVSPAYTVLSSKKEIHSGFYRHFFKSYIFIEKYLSVAVIGIRDGKQISSTDFDTVKIPYPDMDEQIKIASQLDTARQEIELLKDLLDKYRSQKRGLMQKLLTGEWQVGSSTQSGAEGALQELSKESVA